MADAIKVDFLPFGRPKGGDAIVFAGDDGQVTERVAQELGRDAVSLIARIAKLERFKGKPQSAMTIPAPDNLKLDRLIVVGVGGEKDRAKHDWRMLGGFLAGKAAGRAATVLVDAPGLEASPDAVAEMALGARLRAYKFDRYKTKKKNGSDEDADAPTKLVLAVQDPAAAKKAVRAADGLAAGVLLARDLVNEPPNVLDPEEFARRAQALEKLGVAVEVLDEKALRKLNMRALLGVGQGSAKESRVVIMRWNGARENAAPVAFVGKGVVFDSGGISIKPGGGMEDMKGDMAGAACVVGLMHALASRKAKANVIGAIGLVENMPDGEAQRPGDIVTTVSGQTIEIINTDAEGRLVLADLLWHVQERFKPRFMVDLATLTGRHPGGPRAGICGPLLQQRRARRASRRRRPGDRRARVAHAARARIRQDDRFEIRRHEEHRRPQRRLDHRGAAPAALRQRRALGASRHRRHRHERAAERDQQELGLGLGRAPPRPPRARPLRRLTAVRGTGGERGGFRKGRSPGVAMALERETYADDAARVIAHGRLGREAASAERELYAEDARRERPASPPERTAKAPRAAASRPGPPSP